MPRSVNKVILVGNVGKDPEVRYSASGTPVANFSLATNEKFKDRNDQWQERTEWHSIVAWKRLAEIVGEHVAKGSKLYVEGKKGQKEQFLDWLSWGVESEAIRFPAGTGAIHWPSLGLKEILFHANTFQAQ
jgi:single stranded DNA-binding protein